MAKTKTKAKTADLPESLLPKEAKVPQPSANATELRTHFSLVGNVLALTTYDVAVKSCLTCLKVGENTVDRAYGRPRFCSDKCESVHQAYEATFTKPKQDPEVKKGKTAASERYHRKKAAAQQKEEHDDDTDAE